MMCISVLVQHVGPKFCGNARRSHSAGRERITINGVDGVNSFINVKISGFVV